jgi:hypothetical protein
MQISTDTSTWLMQARDFLHEARLLKPGPARNELRQTAKVLRELAKLEADGRLTIKRPRAARTTRRSHAGGSDGLA